MRHSSRNRRLCRSDAAVAAAWLGRRRVRPLSGSGHFCFCRSAAGCWTSVYPRNTLTRRRREVDRSRSTNLGAAAASEEEQQARAPLARRRNGLHPVGCSTRGLLLRCAESGTPPDHRFRDSAATPPAIASATLGFCLRAGTACGRSGRHPTNRRGGASCVSRSVGLRGSLVRAAGGRLR